MKKPEQNNISLDGQMIEINNRKYTLLEFKNGENSFTTSKPLFKATVDLTVTKIGESIT